MSDDESEYPIEHKRPRLPNACNPCRSKKVKCDSAIMPGNICSNCIAYRTECIRDPAKRRGPRIGHSQGTQTVEAVVDAILSTRRPFEVPKDPVKAKEILVRLANHIKLLQEDNDRLRQGISSKSNSSHGNSPPPPSSDSPDAETPSSLPRIMSEPLAICDGYTVEDLIQNFNLLEYDDNCARHFGSSSNRSFVRDAMNIQKEYTENAGLVDVRHSFKRLDFWTVHPWQKPNPRRPPPPYEFPPDDLMYTLFDLYFTHINPLLLFLHRPSFLRSVAEGLHRTDRYFGGLVLSVCALAARFSNDSRVLEDNFTSERSIGWKWIRQIQPIRHDYVETASIYEIQMYLAYINFVGSSTTPEICWILISIGVRLLQDVGVHRKRPAHTKPTVESELWTRAFWMLNMYDIFASTMLGRPRSMSQNDFDTDLPIDCDDEYWEHSAFQQPPGIPSSTSYWIAFLKLMDILGLTLHTIHAVKPTDMWSATVGLTKQEWNGRIVSELNSLLNNWVDKIPDHLKWDPNRENIQHFDQSVVLYTTYYWAQILVHRPFIPRPGEDPHPDIPSLAICANAARSCLHIVEVHHQRGTNAFLVPNVIMALFHSSIVLLMNMWRGKYLLESSSLNISKDLADVHRAINVLHSHEQRWEYSGRLADILMEVISVSHFHPSQFNLTNSTLKRPRIDSSDNPSLPQSSSSTMTAHQDTNGEERPIAGSSRVLAALDKVQNPSNPPNPSNSSPQFSLPLNSSELGRLPIYEPLRVDWNVAQDQWLMPSEQFEVANAESSSSYPGSSDAFMNLASEGHATSSFEGFDTSSSAFPGDWTSYMATVDEVLRETYSRAS
ncbi:fungal-specific transcription factor domain-containing protein [Lentinula raphanica]|nr:fungal-specific transcription factor domain-containing protein [Lentinula raphanica]